MATVLSPQAECRVDVDMATVKWTDNVKPVDPEETTDPAHFNLVVEHKWDGFVRYVVSRLQTWATRRHPVNWADAEDIVTQAMTAAYQNLRKYRSVGPLAAWLYGFLRQMVRHVTWHTRAKLRPILVEPRKLTYIGGHYWPDDDRNCPIDREAVRNGISDLQKTRRDIVTERHLNGLTLQEVADKRGISRQRVHQILQDGYGKLRQSLASFAPTTTSQPREVAAL